jgi:hypothetical protein
MRRGLLLCGGIILAWVAASILTSSPDLFADGKTWFPPDYSRIIGLSMIVQGPIVALGAALCLGRAFIPLKLVPARSGTTASEPGPATTGGGPVLPICGMFFLFAVIGLFVGARVAAGQIERLEGVSRQMSDEPVDPHRQSRDELVDLYRWRERVGWTFGVLWLVVGGMLLGTPLFLKPRAWRFAWRINGAGGVAAIGGLFLSGVGLFVWRTNGMFLRGAYQFYNLVGLLGVLVGTIVTVSGGIMAVARHRPRD